MRPLTDEDLAQLKSNSAYSLPDNPSNKGLSAQQIKSKLYLPHIMLFNRLRDAQLEYLGKYGEINTELENKIEDVLNSVVLSIGGTKGNIRLGDGLFIRDNTLMRTKVKDLFETIDSLPENPDDTKLYLIPSPRIPNRYDVYVYANNEWRPIGAENIDLETVALKEDLEAVRDLANKRDSYIAESEQEASAVSMWDNSSLILLDDEVSEQEQEQEEENQEEVIEENHPQELVLGVASYYDPNAISIDEVETKELTLGQEQPQQELVLS